jgi:large subunit ribosomal protein L17
MHRHGYIGRKLQMAAGPRRALVRGQITSLILHEAITTTEAKAKEVAPQFERVVTYAKKGTLASARDVRALVMTEIATQKLYLELLPAFEGRQGGYTRIIKLAPRRGDNAPMVRLSLVLNDVKPADKVQAKTPAKKAAVKKDSSKQPAAVGAAAKTSDEAGDAK